MDDTDTDPLRVRHDWSTTPPSVAVVTAIAAREDVDPLEVRTELGTLYDHVDPEALDVLVTGGGPVSISFRFDGYDCHIDGDGITVTEA